MMKAYEVTYKDMGWCDFVHAPNERMARQLFWKCWSWEGDFVDIRARRAPALDDKPLTGINIVSAGFNDEWLNGKSDACKCELCKRVPEAG